VCQCEDTGEGMSRFTDLIEWKYMKTCKRCHEEKELSEFCKDAVEKDGLRRICNPCNREQFAQWRERQQEAEKPKNQFKRDVAASWI